MLRNKSGYPYRFALPAPRVVCIRHFFWANKNAKYQLSTQGCGLQMQLLEKLFRTISRSGIRRRFRNYRSHIASEKNRLKSDNLKKGF